MNPRGVPPLRPARWVCAPLLLLLAASACGTTRLTVGASSPSASEPSPSAASHLAPLAPGDGCTPAPLPATGSYAGPTLSGPAVTSLRGGAVKASFSLDGTGLVVNLPRPGEHPAIAAGAAECTALASLDANGYQLAQAAWGAGMAIGFGRVTVRNNLLPGPVAQPGFRCVSGCPVPPRLPAATPYHQRLAWVAIVTARQFATGCPAQTGGGVPASPPSSSNHGYEAFLLDATTGAGALIYEEGRPAPCGIGGLIAPSVAVPVEEVSVPWTLTSRSPGGYSGTIDAQVLGCDGYSPTVLIDRDQPSLRVVVRRPIGPPCGPPRQVTLTVHAATVASTLPAGIGHDPTGLYFAVPGSSEPPAVAVPVNPPATASPRIVPAPEPSPASLPPGVQVPFPTVTSSAAPPVASVPATPG
jgi:hypothetical protein